MSGGVYLVHDDGRLIEMREQPYALEADLQELLAHHPDLLAGDQMNSAAPRRWILVAKEAPLPSEEGGSDRWSVDHLFLDQDAIPTIVEVKRDRDTRIRREVVGQMLDYAANAVMYWPIATVRRWYETLCEQRGVDPDEDLQGTLGVGDADQFWNEALTNLQAGKIRLVFVGNIIPNELRRIVEFLNGQMTPAEVLAVEVKQYVSAEGPRTLVPRVIGQTIAAQQNKTGATRLSGEKKLWNESSFFSALETERGVEVAQCARELYRWAREQQMSIVWGTGVKYGSFSPTTTLKGKTLSLFGVYTNGDLEFRFVNLKGWPPFDIDAKRLDLLERLNAIDTFNMKDSWIDSRKSFHIDRLASPELLNQFFQTLHWCLQEIRANDSSEQLGAIQRRDPGSA